MRRPPRSTLTDTLFPYTTLFRSVGWFPASAWRSRPVIFLGKRKGASFRAPLFYVRTTFAIGFRQSEQCARFIGFRFTLSHMSPLSVTTLSTRWCRSEERRGGKECVSRFRFRGSPDH